MASIAVIVCAGQGTRFQSSNGLLKQFQKLESKPLWVHTAKAFQESALIDKILLVFPREHVLEIQKQLSVYGLSKVLSVIQGGQQRQDSVYEGLSWIKNHQENCKMVWIHDGARPFVSEALFTRLWQKRDQGAVIPVLEISDTVKEVQAESVQKTHDRSVLRVAQTPQLFQFDLIWKGYESLQKTKHPVTDDASVLELIGEKVTIVKGEVQNIKITVAEDLYGTSNQIDRSSPVVRVGMGIDIHAFQEGTQVTLGGIQIPYHKALKGHSDADVLTHSICDAILGAASLGDIGTHFPDTDESYRNISSLDLLEKVVDKIQARRYKINHIDATVLAETPKLMPYISEIKQRLAHVLKVSVDQVSIKATTAEKLGFIGRSEGIAAQALATLFRGYNRDLQK